MQGAQEVMKFFKDFAFQLSAILSSMSGSIKSEFSTEIEELRKTSYFIFEGVNLILGPVNFIFGSVILSS